MKNVKCMYVCLLVKEGYDPREHAVHGIVAVGEGDEEAVLPQRSAAALLLLGAVHAVVAGHQLGGA